VNGSRINERTGASRPKGDVNSGGKTLKTGARIYVSMHRRNVKTEENVSKTDASTDVTTSKIDERTGASTCRRDGMAGATGCRAGVKTGKAVPSKSAIVGPVVADKTRC